AITGLSSALASLGDLASRSHAANVVEIELENSTGYGLKVDFYGPPDRKWEGDYQARGVRKSYRLLCQPGEIIGFGAVDGSDRYWGVGDGTKGCPDCGARCGGGLFSKRL